MTSDIEPRYRALKERLAAPAWTPQRRRGELPEYVSVADHARRAGRADWAHELLIPWDRIGHADPGFNFVLALTCRALQDLEAAFAAADRASKLAPTNAEFAFARAQFAFESWRPAASLFRLARRLAPENLELVKNMALALDAEGKSSKATALLEEAVGTNPGWVEGHRQLSSLRVTSGEDAFDRSFAQACDRQPENLSLRLGWFHLLAQAKDWPRANAVIADAIALFPDPPAVRMAEAFYRAETGERLTDEDLFGSLADMNDPGFDLCRVRYLLRVGEPNTAQSIASTHVNTPHARLFWPYLSLCWRLLSDPRFDWLERGGSCVAAVDLGLGAKELANLAATLRGLHVMQKPYLEQSVRGGTQTSRNLFFNPDPNIQNFRKRISAAVERYRDTLPKENGGHPLLSAPPLQIRYSGSWSVLLKDEGFHAAHTHILGWLSSVFYVDLPDICDMGNPPAGHLSVGGPPPELGLALQPYAHIEPKPGRLVLFPSTTWHGAEPFAVGERLTIAFDVEP